LITLIKVLPIWASYVHLFLSFSFLFFHPNPSDVVSGLCSEGFIVATVEISFSNRVTQDYVIPRDPLAHDFLHIQHPNYTLSTLRMQVQRMQSTTSDIFRTLSTPWERGGLGKGLIMPSLPHPRHMLMVTYSVHTRSMPIAWIASWDAMPL
jgi:hypothetical protein